jgi:hypothetical protein
LILFFLLLQVACAKVSDLSNNAPEAIIQDSIPNEDVPIADPTYSAIDHVRAVINDPENISVFVGYTSFSFAGGRVCVVADEERMKYLSNWLSEIDLSNFVEYDGDIVDSSNELIPTEELLIENDDKVYRLMIIFAENYSYLKLIDGDYYLHIDESIMNTITLRGEAMKGSSHSELKEIASSVFQDTTDIQNCVRITVLKNFNTYFPAVDTVYTISKWQSAIIENVFEGTISNATSIDSIDEDDYDFQIVIGETTYRFNSATGDFLRDGIGPYSLDDQWRRLLVMHMRISGE